MNNTWSSLLNFRPYRRMYLEQRIRIRNNCSSFNMHSKWSEPMWAAWTTQTKCAYDLTQTSKFSKSQNTGSFFKITKPKLNMCGTFENDSYKLFVSPLICQNTDEVNLGHPHSKLSISEPAVSHSWTEQCTSMGLKRIKQPSNQVQQNEIAL